MTDKPLSLSTQLLPSQVEAISTLAVTAIPQGDITSKVESAEEEPYTIKCICNFTDDDGNTIYCETCDTWQHIECFYPNNREEAIREDFAHSCAECNPRPLDRQKALHRTHQLKTTVSMNGTVDKKVKRPPSKSHKRKPKPQDAQINGQSGAAEHARHGSMSENGTVKKSKLSHRPSQSISGQVSKRSPSNGNVRTNPANPPSPATTPPDLPDDFQIHHYSASFCSLYDEQTVPNTHNNAFANLAIPTALSRWLREPGTMKQEVGRTPTEVFQDAPSHHDDSTSKLDVKDATRMVGPDTTLRWRFLRSTTPIEKDMPLIELNGEIGFQKDYCADSDNVWSDLSSPLPFVFFHPLLPLYIDTRKEGSLARYVRRSCKPNAQLDTYLSDGSEYHFWLVSDRSIAADEQITLPWDFRLEKNLGSRWLHFLGLSDEDPSDRDEPEMDDNEYTSISIWIHRILSEYGGCACELDNNCAFARFHRQYLHGKNYARSQPRKKQRKPRNHTISPTSTGHATNSRAASEGHGEDGLDHDSRSQSESSRSKPTSRDPTPMRQGSLDRPGILTEPTDRDKRKVQMVEDSFRRMEQQQPARKKKRTSDGTAGASTSKKFRHGSVVEQGHYVDAATSRSKSNSPITLQSPRFANQGKPVASRRQSSAARPRPLSANAKPTYCDASVQTDTVEGEWFSDLITPSKPKKRIISLTKRLLDSKHKLRAAEADLQRIRLSTPQYPTPSVMDVDSPSHDRQALHDGDESLSPSTMEREDIPMFDAALTTIIVADNLEQDPIKAKTPDLRVQLPPVPAFDNTALASSTSTTPISAASNFPLSPFGLPTPTAANGNTVHPSSAKKKLSLSDYTKSRMNKAAGKAMVKTSPTSPEDPKSDVALKKQHMGSMDNAQPAITPTINGH